MKGEMIDYYTKKRQRRILLAQIEYICDSHDLESYRILDLLGIEN